MASTTRELRQQGYSLPATVQIGKEGISDNHIKDIKKQLTLRPVVKVKMLPTFVKDMPKPERKNLGAELARRANARLVQTIGFVFVLARKNA